MATKVFTQTDSRRFLDENLPLWEVEYTRRELEKKLTRLIKGQFLELSTVAALNKLVGSEYLNRDDPVSGEKFMKKSLDYYAES